jgi:hypothetical protein
MSLLASVYRPRTVATCDCRDDGVERLLERHPTAGVAHGAFDYIDQASKVSGSNVNWTGSPTPAPFETGREFIEQAMGLKPGSAYRLPFFDGLPSHTSATMSATVAPPISPLAKNRHFVGLRIHQRAVDDLHAPL